MPVEEFWKGDPDLFWAYRFSYFNKQKNLQEINNSNSWLLGAYFHEAVSVALCNAFNKTKVEYSKKPYDIFKENKEISNNNNEILLAKLKGRVSQVQSIFKNKESSTTT